MPAAKGAIEVEGLTEFETLEPDRIDGVSAAANGFPVLLMKSLPAEKAVNAVGGVNEKPDVAGAERILQELARLIQSEAAEMAVGNWGEQHDIQLLCEAASLLSWFRSGEMGGDEDDGLAKSVEGVSATGGWSYWSRWPRPKARASS